MRERPKKAPQSKARPEPRRLARPAVVIAAIVFATSGFVSWKRSHIGWGVDFAQLWLGAKLVSSESAAVYGPESQKAAEDYLRSAFRAQQSANLLRVINHREELVRMQGGEWLAASIATPFLYTMFAALPSNYERALRLG